METLTCLTNAAPIWTLSLLILVHCPTGPAQQMETDHIAADAPRPLRASMEHKPQVESPRSPRLRLSLNNLSVATLIAGEMIDSLGTYRNMTHHKWLCGNSHAFAGSYDTNVPGEITSLQDVKTMCGQGPGGRSANWAFDTTQAGYFSEGGWVTQFHLAGERNFAAVEAWNIGNDFAWYLTARHLERRGGWIGKIGRTLNFSRGIIHIHLGIGNLIAVRHTENPNSLNLHVPQNSNYSAPRWWGKH